MKRAYVLLAVTVAATAIGLGQAAQGAPSGTVRPMPAMLCPPAC
ncbi:MAG TPA: hypothetical protein VMH47_05205 [Gaiellaceae bacterium]|nr:hypothetical protein [Gaiellaceae bacterium]